MIKLFTKKYRAVWLPVLFALGVLFLLIKPADPRNTIYTKINGAIDPHPELLIRKYEQFRHIYDSLEKLSAWKANRISPSIEKQLWWFGVTKLNECDSCNETEITEKNKLQFKNKYFFVLKDYTLGYNSFFKIEKGKYIVRNLKWERTDDGVRGNATDIESKVRFAYNGGSV